MYKNYDKDLSTLNKMATFSKTKKTPLIYLSKTFHNFSNAHGNLLQQTKNSIFPMKNNNYQTLDAQIS